MTNLKNMLAAGVALAVIPTVAMAQTEDQVNRAIEETERRVSEAQVSLQDLQTVIDQAVKNADRLENAVKSGRTQNGVAARIAAALQEVKRLQDEAKTIRQEADDVRGTAEDLIRDTQDAKSEVKQRVKDLLENAKKLQAGSADAVNTLFSIRMKLEDLQAKIAGSGLGTGP